MPVKHSKIAVLLGAYNGMQWIEEQLISILGQSGVDVTVYISIDPSTDGTEAWCATFAGSASNVVVLPNEGKFGGAARNFFRLIRDVDFNAYDFIAFSDQDDIWHLDKLLRAINAIEARGVDAYSSNVTAFWPDGKAHLLDKAQSQVSWDYLFEAAGPGCTYVLKKELIVSLKSSLIENWKMVQTVSLHDWYFYAFARSNGYSWYIDPVSSMGYRQHRHNQVGANKGLMSLIRRYKAIHNGWWFKQVQVIAHLIGQDENPFVKTWLGFSRWELIKLSFYFPQCRRRGRDKLFFFFICWATAMFGNRLE